MHSQLVSAVVLACVALGAFAADNLVCIGGLCPKGYDCVNDVCVQQCKDIAPDCGPKAYLCNNSLYYDLMTEQCPKTCGRCGGGPKPSCVDNAPGQECKQKSYLCNNSLYYDLMTKECRKTCGRC
ncbi:hypothetical protein QR680_015372 [Steinernema hermaphroditum]|uniref:ShKT domain-containing protein n=1 Tax=Steinernema hermaphroditum TaxID=289476 RepID=A0AA39H7G5_9BILA|nr:hypothetical protein QR680_015372 [Steinernema hermaphroditum]